MISKRSPSPNFKDRPGAIKPDMVIIHYTGMKTGDEALQRLCDHQAEVSAHYMIDEAGRILELVHPCKRAWHAGISHWRGRDNLNHYSIGIELVNKGHEFGYEAFPVVQIDALLLLLADLKRQFEIEPHQYVGHSDIAPDRKDDPGEKFPWQRLARAGFGLYSQCDGSNEQVLLSEQMPDDDMNVGAVRTLHHKLQRVGYFIGGDTGLYDQATRACVTAFQRHWRQSHVSGHYDKGTEIIINDIIYQYATMGL